MSDQPYRYERTHSCAQLQADHAGLDAGAETGVRVSVAGRLMLRREMGKLAFGTLQDSSGRIQLFAGSKWTKDFEPFGELSLGDWIGASGEVVKTKTGELSVKVDEWVVLAEAKRQFPDKWHGLSDVDTRFRQRYVDLWVTDESRFTLQLRSRLISAMRRWLEDRGYVEVETPLLHQISGGATAKPFITHHNALDMDLYLRIAIELHLKRLVVGGFEKVFEIGRVFRNEGLSPRHNPEFTMIELYEAYADYTDMMSLMESLVSDLAMSLLGTTQLTYAERDLDLTPPWRRATMVELIEEHAGESVSLDMPLADLHAIARKHGLAPDDGWGPGKTILEVYEKTTEAALWGPVFVMDYPQEVSPLARPHRSKPGWVERFEPIVAGRELGNAFSELTDPVVQRQNFDAQAAAKAAGDEEAMSDVDEDYIRALEYGLPPTGGLGIGVDRLVMLFADAHHIREVLLFPTLRPEQ